MSSVTAPPADAGDMGDDDFSVPGLAFACVDVFDLLASLGAPSASEDEAAAADAAAADAAAPDAAVPVEPSSADGEVSDGEVSDGEVSDGEVSDGEVSEGEVSDGEVSEGNAAAEDEPAPRTGEALLAALASAEPGAATITLLAGVDLAALDEDGRLAVAAAWQRQAAWVAAQSRAALAAIHTAPEHETGVPKKIACAQEWRSDEVAAMLRWSPLTAARRLEESARLVGELPATLALLCSGEISDQHVAALLDQVAELSDEQARVVESRVLGRAPGQTVAEFKRSVRRAVPQVGPDAAAANRARAIADRGVRVAPRPDGMAVLIATMAAEDAYTVWLALDAVARMSAAIAERDPLPTDAPAPSIDARRADALLAWANDALADPDLPRRQGRKVELQIVIDLPTLLHLAQEPAHLVGYGPIPAEAARELAGSASWHRLVTEPITGALLDYGRSVYRPPQPLVDFLLARDRRCRFPGCARAADACDIDHVIPFEKGGSTASRNCCCLCRRHHRLKTHGGWGLTLSADGAVTWTSPHGDAYRVDPNGQLE